MNMKIRFGLPEDYLGIRPLQKEIAELHCEGRPDLFKTEPRYFGEEDFRERCADPKHTVLIAEENGRVVGYAFAWVVPYRDHPVYRDLDCFYIDDICVLRSHQRRGIGKRLFERCKEIAKEKNCKMLDLGVWAFNQEAITFYESCGMTMRIHKMEYRLDQ